MSDMNEIKGLNYYERHLGDYAKETFHLSLLEHGVYTVLLDRCFATCQPIPQSQVYRYARASKRSEKQAVDAVLAEFFFLKAGWYFSKLVMAYLEAKDKRAQTSKENGKLGGRPSRKLDEIGKPNDNNRLENEKPNQNLNQTYQEPNPNLKKPVPIAINPITINKAKAQQQLIRARVNAAPAMPPVDDSLPENVSAPPKPKPAADAEPATDTLPTPERPTASAATADPVPAEPAGDSETDVAAVWRQLTTQQRQVVAQQIGATEPALWALTEWWQFPDHVHDHLIRFFHAMRDNRLHPADPSPSVDADPHGGDEHPAEPLAEPAGDSETDVAAVWATLTAQQRRVIVEKAGAKHNVDQCVATDWPQFSENARQKLKQTIASLQADDEGPADSLPTSKTEPNPPAEREAEPLAGPDSPLAPLAAPLINENEADKGILHADPNKAKNEQKQTDSENPASRALPPVTDLAQLQAMGVPESIDLAVWQDFEQMARAKVNWSSATCATLARQLRQTVEAGADGNALLEWVTVRSLLDLPDAWQRMQSDAARAAKQRDPNTDASAAEPLAETAAETVTEPLADHNQTPNATLTQPDAEPEPKHNLKQPRKAKKNTTERGDRLPDDWRPSDELMLWAQQKYPNVDAFSQMEQFCDYWRSKPGKEGRKLDWDATFRNWIRRADEFEKKSGFKSPGALVSKLMPHANGRLPGESAADFSLRLYLEDRQKQAANGNSPAIKLFNSSSPPALPHINGDTP